MVAQAYNIFLMRKTTPIVAIIGRANVGKSSILNASVGFRRAIIAQEAGTTRDSVAVKANVGAQEFWLVDTAGLKAAEDEFESSIQEQIREATDSADLIWVVVDSASGITDEDRRVAKLALKSKKTVFLVLNKSDKLGRVKLATDWTRLGISNKFLTSATQNRGFEDLLLATAKILPTKKSEKPADKTTLAILGRPNAGKSSLFNALAKKQQVLVSERAGTTRDVIRLDVAYGGQTIELADTAGIRRSGKIEKGIERFSVLRALEAIEEADIALLVMDQTEPGTHLDQKIAGMVAEAGKGLILVVSKWDEAELDASRREQVAYHLSSEFVFTPWAPLIFTSAITGLNVTKLFELSIDIAETRRQKITTAALNRWLRDAADTHPPAGLKNRQPKLRYIVQEDGFSPPSFKIFGTQTKYLHWSYKRYLEKSFRQLWPYNGTPLKFWFIEKADRS